MRTEDEIRKERDKWKAQGASHMGRKGQEIEALMCSSIVSVLSWALGEVATPTTRVKLRNEGRGGI